MIRQYFCCERLTLGGLSLCQLANRTWTKLNENEILTRASAVAFYAMLALVPFLALILTLVIALLPDLTGRFPHTAGVGDLTVTQLERTLKTVLPREASEVVMTEIARVQKSLHPGLISLGLLMTIWLASSPFVAVMDAMNRIHGLTETRPFWKVRVTAIVLTLVVAVILVGSLIAVVAWPQLLKWMGLSEPAALLATAARWIAVVVGLLCSFALTYHFAPAVPQKWKWITPGSVIGTVCFLIETFLFRLYVQEFANYNKTYGSLGGVMVLMFWFWLTSVVLLVAGQINENIEEASWLKRSSGRRAALVTPPDFRSLEPEPARPSRLLAEPPDLRSIEPEPARPRAEAAHRLDGRG
jgi:membrane protein